MATAFLAMNQVFGPVWLVSEAEAADKDLVAARAKGLKAPGQGRYSTSIFADKMVIESGAGTENKKPTAGVDMLRVPYKGEAPSVTDILGGTINSDCAKRPTVCNFAVAEHRSMLTVIGSSRTGN